MGRKTNSTKSWNRRQTQRPTSSASDHADVLYSLRNDSTTEVSHDEIPSKTGTRNCNTSATNNIGKTAPPDTINVHERSRVGTNSVVSSSRNEGKETSIFPRHLQWLCFLVTLLFRLWYVTTPENWWILHPDEVFQTVEVAHSETFGYAFKPYEYLPPPGNDVTNETISTARAQEIRHGMYSLRSFLLIRVIAYVMWIAEWSGFNISPFLVAKVFHAAVSSSLLLAVFSFTRALYKSRDAAMLAAIFVSSSVSLNVFGTHTLINSFLSPLIFISLVPFIKICKSRDKDETSAREFKVEKNAGRSSNTVVTDRDELIQNNNSHTASPTNNINGLHLNILPTNGLKTGTNCSYFLGSYLCNSKTVDVNANISAACKDQVGLSATGTSGKYASGQNGHYSVCGNGHYLHGQNGHLINGTRELYSSKTSSLTNGYHQQQIQGQQNTDIKKWNNYILNNATKIYHYAMGLFLALCVYIRPDSLMPIVFLCPMCIFSKRIIVALIPYAFGIATGLLIGGFVDYVTYGAWFLSPVQWFKFNVLNKLSGALYGTAPWDFYLTKLYNNEPLILLLLLTLTLDVLCSYIGQRHARLGQGCKYGARAWNQTTIVFICMLFIYSLNGHKELRFLHNGIILMYISFARAIVHLYQLYETVSANQNNRQYYMYFVYIFIALFVSSHHYDFINTKGDAISKWTYGGHTGSQVVNSCLDFIRRQHDVTGVFMDRHLHTSGGYSTLHKDVPIIALNKHEFVEYDMQSRFIDQTYSIDGTVKHVSVLGRISEFISVYHTDYLLKFLLAKTSYNYLVIRSDREFIDIGYHEVFRTNDMKVLKRSMEIENEVELKKTADGIPIGTNATILEYEGDWLKHFGLYRKAEQRLVLSNRLDPKRLGPFQILLDMYNSQGNHADYKQVMKACKEVHDKKLCRQPYVPSQLHENYYREVNKNSF